MPAHFFGSDLPSQSSAGGAPNHSDKSSLIPPYRQEALKIKLNQR